MDALQRRVVWQQQKQQIDENVGSRNRLHEFLEERLEILLCRLLAMKTDYVIEPFRFRVEALCGLPIGFGLLDPLHGLTLHITPFQFL